MASLQERMEFLSKFKPVKLVAFMFGAPSEENTYELWYSPAANVVSVCKAIEPAISIMSMSFNTFLKCKGLKLSKARWPENVLHYATNMWRRMAAKKKASIMDNIPINALYLAEQYAANHWGQAAVEMDDDDDFFDPFGGF